MFNAYLFKYMINFLLFHWYLCFKFKTTDIPFTENNIKLLSEDIIINTAQSLFLAKFRTL